MTDSKSKSNPAYAAESLAFVRVAAEFCAFVEQSEGRSREDFAAAMLKLLPLVYLKAHTLPKVQSAGSFLPDQQLTEQDYNYILSLLARVLGDADDFEMLIAADAAAAGQTQVVHLSELLADIYQCLRNFVAAYQLGVNDCMRDALWLVAEEFETYWGQRVADALARLHAITYSQQ